jgi:SAM-dependent methyltransferase
MSGFDEYAEDYDRALAEGLAASGEGKDYFAIGRVNWLGKCLSELESPGNLAALLDYGCGTGSTTPLLRTLAPEASVLGVDISRASLRVAERRAGSEQIRFANINDVSPKSEFDLAYCNGIFHHIAPRNRAEAARYIYDALRPGGVLGFWENNPWNIGTRWVMSRIPFDRDAIPLSILDARHVVKAAGFQIVRTDFLFIFPRFLKGFRFLEPALARFPLGGQYQILCRKPFS